MTAHNKFKSLDVELLTQLCKELRNRYGDEVAYDGALLLAATVVSCSWLASQRRGVQLSMACGLVLLGTAYGERLVDRNTKKLIAAFEEGIAASAFG